ncbi:peptidase T [Saprospira grandis DSM 2844]|uniref:Peptidase T n=1 Tax=Saprospira grandis DSM 2844 TaxID=694433 RepID=J1I690_9BACT|nr:peptidase T [Saprospira grandis]EJF53903.1 peptidase T [Saprospira grandis DSM 2844]
MKEQILERFLRYVKIDSMSEFGVDKIPSTEKQWDMAKTLEAELKNMGMQEVDLDEHCYLMATLPSNSQKNIPTIGFVAHIDSSPDFISDDVRPKVWPNYQGQSLALDEEAGIFLSPKEFPEMLKYKGQTLITTSGNTLLSADDKAGVTEIMSAMDYLIQHPEIEHGKIRICFTPDEEVGRGADLFDVEKFAADWAYTMDGSEVGELEYENFNAAYAKVTVQGKSVHPGYAKGKMVNSHYLAAQFILSLPLEETPEHTEDYEGFYHLNNMKASVDQAEMLYIVRDHDRQKFEDRKQFFEQKVADFNQKHNNCLSLEMKDQYYNMREKIEPLMHIVDLAEAAMKDLNITPLIKPIRGGTDGSRLSYMGLPCPNIFAGGMNFHGRYEYVALESMVLATQLIVRIAERLAEEA